jgi:O-antigen/teichoic acid export membrane protein
MTGTSPRVGRITAIAAWPGASAGLFRAVASSSLHRGAFGIMAAGLGGSVLGALGMALAARIYSPADVGSGLALMTTATFLGTVASLSMGTGLIRFLPSAADPRRLIVWAVALTVGLAIATGAIVTVLRDSWAPGFALLEDPIGQLAFIAAIVANSGMMLQDGFLIANRQGGAMAIRTIASGGVRMPILLVMTGFGATGILGSWLIATSLPVLVLLIRARPVARRAVAGASQTSRLEVLRFSSANYAIDVVIGLPTAVMPLLIVGLIGSAANAYYSLGLMAALVGYSIARAAGVSLMAESSYDAGSTRHNAGRALRFTLLLTVPMIAAAWVLAEPVLGVFGAPYASEGAWVLRILVASALPLAAASIYSSVCRSSGRLTELFAVSIAAGLLAIAIGAGLLSVVGIVGAAIAIFAWQTILAAVGLARLTRILAAAS